MGCHFLLQGFFPTPGSNLGLLHCRQTLYCLSHQGSPGRIHYCYIILRNVEGKNVCPFFLLENSRPLSPWGPLDFLSILPMVLRESFPRQIDKKSRRPQGERGLEFSRRKKGQTFFFLLHSLGLCNNNVSCVRTVSGKNLLANPVILKCKLWG